MNDNSGCGCLLIIVTLAVALLVGYWFFNAVMASELPDWLKYLILR